MTKINKKNLKQLDDELWAELSEAKKDLNDDGVATSNKSSKRKNGIQNQTPVQNAKHIKGLVIASYGQYSLVRIHDLALNYISGSQMPEAAGSENSTWIECVNKGRDLDPVVGDFVEITITSHQQGRIERVIERKNLLYRSDAYKSKAFAANLDALIWVIAPQPRFNQELLDRAMIAATSINIPLKIVLNKSDLDCQEIEPLLRIYRHLDYQLYALNKNNRQDILHFFQQFNQQRVILLGQSGMGKSTLLNVLMPELNIKTREVSTVLNTGKHTTTHSKLYQIQANIATNTSIAVNQMNTRLKEDEFSLEIIDSPGFQIFGLHHLSNHDYLAGFAEFTPFLGHCRFHNCRHLSEPNCAILQAVKQEKIHELRYQSYFRLCEEANRKTY